MIDILLTILGLGGVGVTYFVMNKKLTSSIIECNRLQKEKNDAEKINVELNNKREEFIETVKEKMNLKVIELEEKYKKNADERVQKVINDYEEALKLETESLETQVAELDEQLGLKLKEITGKNTMYFTCACDRSSQIPCSVDLSDEENYFTCPQCGAVYRVVINTSTILMSGISNNHAIATMYDGKEIGAVDRTSL
jgi:hypothetical protein